MPVIAAPTYTEFVNQQLSLEPLKGPNPPKSLLDRFPDELYNKAPESHLLRAMYALLGPAGAGYLRKQSFELRLQLEAMGFELFDLDSFYGNPFGFGRITEEMYDSDPTGTLTRDEWDAIKRKDESYRARAIDFMNGARAGNTPLGMRLVARSGIGHEVEIVENYRHLFDRHSDDPLGLPWVGKTHELNEFIVLPRQETAQSEEQTLTITGNPTGGSFVLKFRGEVTQTINWKTTTEFNGFDPFDVESALERLASVGEGNVRVRGVAPESPMTIRFVAELSQQDVPQLEVIPSLTGGETPGAYITTSLRGISNADEALHITSTNRHHLQAALDRIKPITAMATVGTAPGHRQPQPWASSTASSEYNEVIRYVTGQPAIQWKQDDLHWIESGKEKEAKRVAKDLQYHYVGFHNVKGVIASTTHIGRFTDRAYDYPYLNNIDDELEFSADRVLADYSEPLTMQSMVDNVGMINGIYPSDYLSYRNVPEIKYKEEQFWASAQMTEGTDWIMLDLGATRAVNYLAMELAQKPFNLSIHYDDLDQPSGIHMIPVTFSGTNPTTMTYSGSPNPWEFVEYNFEDAIGKMIYTRYIRIDFERVSDEFATNAAGDPLPWSIDVRNLRIGRNVSNY